MMFASQTCEWPTEEAQQDINAFLDEAIVLILQ